VTRLRGMLIIILLGVAVCVSVAPRADLPGTAFNESDTPVTLSPPRLPRIQISAPGVDAILILPTAPLYCAGRVGHNLVLAPVSSRSQRRGNSLQNLLCTFLI
jgi:hypothetical protein